MSPFDIDPMTLILKCDLNMIKMCLYTKMKLLAIAAQKLQPKQADTQKHTQTDRPN